MYSAYYYDGIYAWGIEDPSDPVLLGYYDTSVLPHQISYEGAWGVYPFLSSGNILVSDMQTGLWVFSLDTSLSTDEKQSGPTLNVWPNPASEVIRVQSGTKLESYSITNINGQTVQAEQALNGNRIDVSHLPSGIYILNVSTPEGSAHRKILVE